MSSVTETERAWLAGFWDGEGSIALFHNQEKNGSDKIKPVLTAYNTDYGLINKALDIFSRADCNPYIVLRKQSSKNSRHRDCVEIKFSSVTSILPALQLMLPYLSGVKRAKGEILLRYLLRRQEKYAKGDQSYDERDWSDLEEIRSSETTRAAPEVNSTLWKKI